MNDKSNAVIICAALAGRRAGPACLAALSACRAAARRFGTQAELSLALHP